MLVKEGLMTDTGKKAFESNILKNKGGDKNGN